MLRGLLVCSLSIVLSAGPAMAEPVMLHDADEPVAGHGDLTYADLVGQFLPGLRLTASGAQADGGFALRHIDGDDFSQELASTVSFRTIEALPIDIEGAPHLALLVDLGGSDEAVFPSVALAVYELDDRPRLIDVVDVSGDRSTGFAPMPKVPIGKRDDVLVVNSWHGNSNQFYQSASLITLAHGELSLIDTILTLSDLYCGVERDQSVTVLAQKSSSGGKWPIEAVVTDELAHNGEPCEDSPLPEPFTVTYSTRYAWSASLGLYVRADDAWDKLDEVNSKRY